MKKLLKSNELRRLTLVELLTSGDTWMTTTQLAELLDSSMRVVKNDIAFLRESQDIFELESSYQGVRIHFKLESNLKEFYQKILRESVAFNALELIFFNNSLTADKLIEKLYVSESTLYRNMKEIDEALQRSFGLRLSLNNFQIAGPEQKIRYFYYVFFYEKYLSLEWPFSNIKEEALDQLLNFFVEFTGVHMNYAYYRNFKLVAAVNITRMLNGYFVNFDKEETNFTEIISDEKALKEALNPITQQLNFETSFDTILQVFNNYVRKDFALNYDRLIENAKKDKELLASVQYLKNVLKSASDKFEIPLSNGPELIWHISNAAYNEGFESHSGYILYNRNKDTLKAFQENFPDFYLYILEGLTNYRQMVDRPLTQFSIAHLVFQLFVCWENLLPELQNKWEKIKALLISDINNGHGNLIKDQISVIFY